MNTLRSNFTPGTTEWAVRRSQWRALGIADEEMDKPKIAVVNSSSELSSCFSHLDSVAATVKAAITEAGGLPFEVRTTAPSDFITSAGKEGRYILASRDLVVNDIEVVVEGARLDGMVCLSSCDKTAPAHLMAAGRLNIPTVIVIGGYQSSGHCFGKRVDIEEVFESVGAVRSGDMTVEHLKAMTECAITGPGVCAGMGTANTMHILAEALGMTPSGSAPVLGGSERMYEMAAHAGHLVVDLIAKGIRPRDIMTAEAFDNAVVALLGAGGSINGVRHLQAVAVEAQSKADIYELLDRRSDVPLLCGVRPVGGDRIEDLDAAGGARALLGELSSLLNTEALTVDGITIGEIANAAATRNASVIRRLTAPYKPGPSLTVFHGSLAPSGALAKLGAAGRSGGEFVGPARVFESQADAIGALSTGAIRAGDVVVVRGLGPKGGPGMGFASWFTAALSGTGLADKVAVLTDGQLSGLNRGLTVGQITPEAAAGGPFALVSDDDRIAIDLDAKTVDLLVEESELERRSRQWQPPASGRESGWLAIYEQTVQSLARGAVLGARD